jgi:hypothetical protein
MDENDSCGCSTGTNTDTDARCGDDNNSQWDTNRQRKSFLSRLLTPTRKSTFGYTKPWHHQHQQQHQQQSKVTGRRFQLD